MGQQNFTTTGSTLTWNWVTGVSSVTIESYGAGGAGGAATGTTSSAGGGRGGGYSSVTINKGAESSLSITVGAGGVASATIVGNGGTSFVTQGGTTVCLATGGNGAPTNASTTTGVGGTTSNGTAVGTITRNGGSGGTASATISGAGGGGAGSTGVGGNASAGTAGTSGGGSAGAGGTGVAVRTAGNTGAIYGGGGSGGNTNQTTDRLGGSGAQGIVILSWTDPIAVIGQTAFGFYEEGTESGSTLIGSINTNITRLIQAPNLLLRIRIQETGGGAGISTDDYSIYYSKNGGTYSSLGTDIIGFSSSVITEASATTNRLGVGSGSFIAGKSSKDGVVDDFTLTASNYTEFLYAITLSTVNLVVGDILSLRIYRNSSALSSYSVTPTITISTLTSTTIGIGSISGIQSITF